MHVNPATETLIPKAAATACRTTGAELIQQRHLIAAALTSARLPVELATVLGADKIARFSFLLSPFAVDSAIAG
jgi:hypothetical protein